MYTFYFQNLDVWKNSKELALEVYKVARSLPKSEQFNIVSQINRAAISVPSNLAEGVSRKSFKEQARFTSISFGSLMELLNLLIISHELGYISENSFNQIQSKIEIIAKQLNALRKSQIKGFENKQ